MSSRKLNGAETLHARDAERHAHPPRMKLSLRRPGRRRGTSHAYLGEMSHHEIGRILGISHALVQIIEVQALAKIRKAFGIPQPQFAKSMRVYVQRALRGYEGLGAS